MRRIHLVVAAACAAIVVSGCGSGSSSSSTPTSPSNNQAPSLTSMTVSPTFGISELTEFTYAATASDPNGDALSYTWDLAGNPASGSSGRITFRGNGGGAFRVTVSDGKGGSATDTRSIMLGNMTGTWTMNAPPYGTFTMTLSQDGPIVSGTFSMPTGFGNAPNGSTGKTDPAEPGTINKDGKLDIRLKVGIFLDFYLRGTMDSTGRHISGGMFQSGFTGQPFTMDKQ